MSNPAEASIPKDTSASNAVSEIDLHKPTLRWPLTGATIVNQKTNIYPSSLAEPPRITIETPPYAEEVAIRSPTNGRIAVIEQQDETSTIVLFADYPGLIVIIGGVPDIIKRSKTLQADVPADPDLLHTVREGEPIGTIGPSPHNSITIQIALQHPDPKTSVLEWKLVNPQDFLPPRKSLTKTSL
jgi:hypothetical protein